MELSLFIIIIGLLLMVGAILVIRRMPDRYGPGIPNQLEELRQERGMDSEIAQLKEEIRAEIERLKTEEEKRGKTPTQSTSADPQQAGEGT